MLVMSWYRARMVALAAVVTALLVAGVAASLALPGGLPGEGGYGRAAASVPSLSAAFVAAPLAPAPKRLVRPAAATAPASPPPAWIATLHAPTPYSQVPGGPPEGTLPATNPFGAPEVLALVGQPGPPGWAEVELPIRPNGSLGYIPTGQVTLTQTTYRVEVNLEAHTVTVLDSGTPIMTVPAAVGSPSSPTPTGRTYLWELIRPDNPHGAYGPYIFGLALYSDTYAVFNGGDAQIGLHGQDEPWSVGHPVSHGCIRVHNSVITQLAGMLPLGTPVYIS